MEERQAPQELHLLSAHLSSEARRRLTHFKEFAVSHPVLQQVDTTLMRAIREPAGFTHLLVYGPSGVGKSTMMRQVATRVNDAARAAHHGGKPPVPLLRLETRPPDASSFNRTAYYRTALRLLGEPFFERRVMVDIETEHTWEKKGRKAARFHDSPELRMALEDALRRYEGQAVILGDLRKRAYCVRVGMRLSSCM